MPREYCSYIPEKKETVLICGGFFLAFTAAGYIFYGIFYCGIFLPMFYLKLKNMYCSRKAARQRNELLLQFRDFLYSLSASFAAGRHLMEAMEEAEENLEEVYGKNSSMAEEIRYMLRRMQETGETDLIVLENFAQRSGLEDTEDFVQVFRACRETGGNLVQAVNKAAAVIGDKINIEAEIHAMVAQKKLEGRIITVMPVLVILFLQLLSPDYLQIMYTTLAGRILMTVGLAGIACAYVMIERITAIEV